jgi:hypothetical protein
MLLRDTRIRNRKGRVVNIRKSITVVCLVLLTSACATKRYGRMQPVTGQETAAYSCKEIKLELSKVDAFELQVAEGAEFSVLSVASFLGDLGIGNTIEKNSALKTAKERRVQLNNMAAAQDCP